MTRIFTDGAEMGDLLFWDSTISITGPATDYPRSGTYAYKVEHGDTVVKNIPELSEFYFRMGWRIDAVNSEIIHWRNGSTILGSLKCTTNGQLTLYVGNTLVATGTIVVQPATYYCVELHVKIANSGGILEVKVDGVADPTATYSGDTQPGSATTVNNLFENSASGKRHWFDDLALNDTSGVTDNSWCGDGRVIYLSPNANGDSSEWTGSDGNSVDNYALVDERPPSSSDYVESDTLNELDLYNLSASGLTANDTILRVWAEARAADTVADGGKIALSLKTESSVYDSGDLALLTTYTKQLIGAVHTVNPSTSAAWTPTQLDALQVGPKNRS